MKPADPRFRILYAAWAFFEVIAYGGLIYGWGSLVYILKDEGLYMELCETDVENITVVDLKLHNSSTSSLSSVSYATPTTSNTSIYITDIVHKSTPAPVSVEEKDSCDARDARLNLVFTIGSAMFCVGCFVMGQINYKFGTRVTRVIASILFIIGAFMIAFTSVGVSRQTSYIVLAVTHLLTFISTFFFLPKHFIEKPGERPVENALDENQREVEIRLANNGKPSEFEPEEDVKPTLISQMSTPTYILHVYWLSVLQLRFYFLLGSLNTMLEKLLDSKDEVSRFTNETSYILMCGLFTSPLAGAFYAMQNRFFARSLSPLRRNLMPTVVPLGLTTVLGILMSAIILIEKASVIYAVFVCLLFFRSFLYTMGAGLLNAIFPNEYFGIMYGIMFIVSGAVSMLQYGLFAWAEAFGFFQVSPSL
ncbi:solute carrier family 43 member 3 [Elysia marginata]|uniref:Solute carrier family 43 member 3 n=1 Tax=Elysia marginata TaxID=1093978 RepID=A0AAV4GEZ9_9GAST|nr:solute carrier family 43 member 3 [Elysia marginata]